MEPDLSNERKNASVFGFWLLGLHCDSSLLRVPPFAPSLVMLVVINCIRCRWKMWEMPPDVACSSAAASLFEKGS
jgi:hypothetical protein